MKQYMQSCVKMALGPLPILGMAQELPEVLPPSPTVANLMPFEEVPAGYHTGQPNVSLPLCSKSLNGDLECNMAPSYNAHGHILCENTYHNKNH